MIAAKRPWTSQLHSPTEDSLRRYAGLFVLFILFLAGAEQLGMKPRVIGYIFMSRPSPSTPA